MQGEANRSEPSVPAEPHFLPLTLRGGCFSTSNNHHRTGRRERQSFTLLHLVFIAWLSCAGSSDASRLTRVDTPDEFPALLNKSDSGNSEGEALASSSRFTEADLETISSLVGLETLMSTQQHCGSTSLFLFEQLTALDRCFVTSLELYVSYSFHWPSACQHFFEAVLAIPVAQQPVKEAGKPSMPS